MNKFLAHLAEKRSKLQKQLLKIQADLAGLDKAEQLYRESGEADAAPESAQPSVETFDAAPEGPGTPWLAGLRRAPLRVPAVAMEGTIKQRVLKILDANPDGLTSGQILLVLKQVGLANLARESLSPQLSRLKAETEIDLDAGTSIWTRVKKHEPQGR